MSGAGVLKSGAAPTGAMLSALLWLSNRNGDGVFDRHQVLTAAGERAPVMRATWTNLATAGMIEFYASNRRIRLTDFGRSVDLCNVWESQP